MNLEVLGYQVGDPFPKEMAVREGIVGVYKVISGNVSLKVLTS